MSSGFPFARASLLPVARTATGHAAGHAAGHGARTGARYAAGTVAILAAAVSTPAAAQVAQAALSTGPGPARSGGVIEEIVVTARQRGEGAQRTPVTMTVLSADRIEAAQIDGIADIASRSPGLVVSDPFGRFNPAPAIRGLTQPGTGEEPSVGFFIDGVYVSGRSSINLFLDDVARVEVLKGPQNALFGRNTFGGAVSIVTRKPGDTVDGFVEAGLGSKGRREVSAAVSTPLIPGKLAARLSFASDAYDGFYDNPVPGGPKIGSEKSQAGAITLRATPTDRLEAVLRVSYAEDDDGQWKGFYLQTNCRQRLTNGVPTGAFTQYCGEIPESGPTLAANPEHFGFVRDAWRSSATVTYDLSFATVTSITAVNAETNEFNRDNDYGPLRLSQAGQLSDRWDASQELHLVGADRGQAVTWLIGASAYRFDNETERRNIEFWSGQTTTTGLPRTDERTDSTALYGSVGWRLRPDVTLTGDLRWQRDWKDFRTTSTDRTGRPITAADAWTLWTPRLTADWRMTERVMLYASAAKGVKSGGFNTMANIFPEERSFGPETNWTYEAGAKTAWFDGRLVANAALFWVDWTDQQVVAASAAGTNNNFYTNNAARSRSRGVEIDLTAAPADGVGLRLAYTFADAEFRDYQDPDYVTITGFAPTGDVSGLALPRQSRHQIAAGLDLDGDVAAVAGLGWFAGAEWLWQSRQYTENTNLSWIPADGKVNLRAGVETGGLRLTVRVQNLFDDRTPPVAVRFSEPTAAGYRRAWLVTPGDGRTWSVQARWSF